jgi:hypothetical protein
MLVILTTREAEFRRVVFKASSDLISKILNTKKCWWSSSYGRAPI